MTQVFLAGQAYEGNLAAGFLGVHMEAAGASVRDAGPVDLSPPDVGVVIVERMPGFAGGRMLRNGDLILGILERPDVPLRNPSDFALTVREMGAGAMVHFVILRQGRVIRVGVKLDSRPLEADQFTMADFLDRRRTLADTYWAVHFAPLMKGGIS